MKTFRCNSCGNYYYTTAFWSYGRIVSDCSGCREKKLSEKKEADLLKLSQLKDVDVKRVAYNFDKYSFEEFAQYDCYCEILFPSNLSFEEFYEKTKFKEDAKLLYDNALILEKSDKERINY